LAELETIPTPLNLKWKRLRYQIVPIVVFCACALATAWLWKDYANGGQAYGEVTAVTYQVASPREGTLIELSEYPKVLDRVTPGKVLAKFDSSKLEARRKDVGEALTKSQKELAEATENLAEAEKGGGAKATVDEFKGKVAALTVVVGESGTILTSRDGATWEARTSNTRATLRSVVWTGAELVAVGGNGAAVRSTDGVTWTVQPTPFSSALFGSDPFDLNDAVWAGGRIVVVGTRGLVATSP